MKENSNAGWGRRRINRLNRKRIFAQRCFSLQTIQDSDGWQPQLGRSLAMSSVTTNNLAQKKRVVYLESLTAGVFPVRFCSVYISVMEPEAGRWMAFFWCAATKFLWSWTQRNATIGLMMSDVSGVWKRYWTIVCGHVYVYVYIYIYIFNIYLYIYIWKDVA